MKCLHRLALLPLLLLACQSEPTTPAQPLVDAAADRQAVEADTGTVTEAGPRAAEAGPSTAEAGTTADARPVLRSCDQLMTGLPFSVPDKTLDALLIELPGSPCEGDLRCELGPPQNCGSVGYQPYSQYAIGCQCVQGKVACRDYRAEARGCGALRQDAGRGD
jgi:hypothetical protein